MPAGVRVDAILRPHRVFKGLHQAFDILHLCLAGVFRRFHHHRLAAAGHKPAGGGRIAVLELQLQQIAAGNIRRIAGNVVILAGAALVGVGTQALVCAQVFFVQLFRGLFQVLHRHPVFVHLHLFAQDIGAVIDGVHIDVGKAVFAGVVHARGGGQIEGQGIAQHAVVGIAGEQQPGFGRRHAQDGRAVVQPDVEGFFVGVEGIVAPHADVFKIVAIVAFAVFVHDQHGARFMVALAFADLCDAAGLGFEIDAGGVLGLQHAYPVAGAAAGDGHRLAGHKHVGDGVVADQPVAHGKAVRPGKMHVQVGGVQAGGQKQIAHAAAGEPLDGAVGQAAVGGQRRRAVPHVEAIDLPRLRAQGRKQHKSQDRQINQMLSHAGPPSVNAPSISQPGASPQPRGM